MFKKFYNAKYTQIGVYIVLFATIIFAINAFIDNVPYWFDMLWDKIVWVAQSSKPIILAFVVAYLLDPVAGFIQKNLIKFKNRIRRNKGNIVILEKIRA